MMKKWLWAALLFCTYLQAAEVSLEGRSAADMKRDMNSAPQQTLALLDVIPGDHVLDLLGGGGYYSELLSQLVGAKGQVLLHNNQAYMGYVGKELEQRLAAGRLANVQRYDHELDQLQLAENSLDKVLFVLGYHDFYYKSDDWSADANKVMQQVRKALKPGGYLLVIDHQAQANSGTAAAQSLHRIDVEFVKAQLAEFGFQLLSSPDFLKNSQDDHKKSVFDPAIRGQTDRFVLLLRNDKP